MIIASSEAAKDGGDGPPVLFMYGIFGGMFVAFGVMIIMQRVLVGEKRSGTAAWVLSKPVTRTGFCHLPVGRQFDRHPADLGDRAWRDLVYNPGII